jgi:transmembrane sensor
VTTRGNHPWQLEAAARWHSRLQLEGQSVEVQQEFARWIAQSSQHQVAYDGVERAWQELRSSARHPSILTLRREAALRHGRSSPRAARSGRWAAIAAVAVTVTVAAVILASRSPGKGPLSAWAPRHSEVVQAYETGVGQRLPVLLPDGSRVTLDTQSQLQMAFTSTEREVRLIRGQALFEVARNPERPFVVAAANRRFVALGTAFDVRVGPQQVKVTMVEGTVRVESAPNVAVAQRTITAGDQFVFDQQQVDRVSKTDPSQATSWLRGQIIFDNTTLAAAVAELNRYSGVQIELGAAKLAAVRISGTFIADRPDLFVEALTNYYPMEASSPHRNVVRLMPR